MLELAGPMLAFTHDSLQEASYKLIEQKERMHKKIGMNLVYQDPEIEKNAEVCTLAVDQLCICKDVDGILDQGERTLAARLNLAAGKHSMSTKKSNYEQGELNDVYLLVLGYFSCFSS